MSTYAWVDLGAALIPLLLSFHPRLLFYKHWTAFAPAAIGMMGLFVPWDALFTRAGIWGFRPDHVWSLRLLHLPIEEWLFFVCVPYACLFTYHCLKVLHVKDHFQRSAPAIGLGLVTVLTTLTLWNWDKAYTATAMMGCALWIGFSAFVQRAPWLGRFYFTYLILLIPFTAVNGILTGTGLEHEVVWYNDRENLGLRILTIPVEDVFYGMLMVGLTTSFYEGMLTLRKRSHERSFTAAPGAPYR
jgi:lycopene cyclase domain-containing protein